MYVFNLNLLLYNKRMQHFSEKEYQRAFDKQSLGKISFIFELPSSFFEVDTDENFTYIGYIRGDKKNQTQVFHRKIELKRSLIETNQGLFLVAVGIPNELMCLWFGSHEYPDELKKIMNRFLKSLGLKRQYDYKETLVSHNFNHYFIICPL